MCYFLLVLLIRGCDRDVVDHDLIIVRVFLSQARIKVGDLFFLFYGLIEGINRVCSVEEAFDSILVDKDILRLCLLIVQRE
jgi:hypothetical protein